LLEQVASDDAFRAAQYLEAQKEHKRDVAANKAEKDLYKYQEAAKGVLTMKKEAKDLSMKDWEAVIRIGVKTQGLGCAFYSDREEGPFVSLSLLHRAPPRTR
jgi:hypothetical protein